MDTAKFTFHIEDFAPADLSMRRLAAYLEQLARLLGEEDLVRFDSVTEGSTDVHAYALPMAAPKVRDRLAAARDGTLPDARRVVNKIDAMLREDNASGALTEAPHKGVIIRFPGAHAKLAELPTIAEPGSLQGVLVRVGGRDATAHALLRDGEQIYSCIVSHELARRLGKHLLGPVVRLHGRGRWLRDRDGLWELVDFRAVDFDVPDNASLEEAAKKLQSAGGFGYREAGAAWNTLREWREED